MNNNTQNPNEQAGTKPAKSPLQKLIALTAANLHVNRGTLETLTRIDESLSSMAIVHRSWWKSLFLRFGA